MGVQSDVSNLADLDRLYDTVKQMKGRGNGNNGNKLDDRLIGH